jgi:hypothetical protein
MLFSGLFPDVWILYSDFSEQSFCSYTFLLMKMDQTDCSETSAYKIQTSANYPEERTQHSEPGESLKSRIYYILIIYVVRNTKIESIYFSAGQQHFISNSTEGMCLITEWPLTNEEVTACYRNNIAKLTAWVTLCFRAPRLCYWLVSCTSCH